MARLLTLVACVLTAAVAAVPAGADDPPKKLTPDERKELVEELATRSAPASQETSVTPPKP